MTKDDWLLSKLKMNYILRI